MKAKKHDPQIIAPLPAGKVLAQSANLFPVVGIGASAGGLDAFKKLLKAIPENSGMAYVLVQHLDPNHESLLPEILQKVTSIPVLEITDDIKVQPNHIYVIPSNKMMVATDGVLLLAPRPAKSKTERNLPIDLFFSSLAEVHQEHAIGVVLSGTASDGTQGLKAIKENGGITFAQDEASAEYEGMPHSAAEAGVVDFILPPGDIPKKLLEVTNKTIFNDEELQNIPKQEEDVFRQILSLLRIRKGVDFTYYKQTTVRRRILRRMIVNKNEDPAEYLKFLRGNNPEQDLLFQDMLIPVTSFFRDKKTFENLCNHVFPSILKNKIPGEITRVWVAGCSTGQEVYSFAICFKEFLGDNHERIQIFGTDLSEPAIHKARTGLYEKTELDSVSPQRLKEYFTKNNGGYQVNKSLRDMCVFAHHNFLKDPPFGKMDCISCRNVLIYMEPYLQKKALTTFHYALNPKGFLLLGKSETTGGVPELFAAVEKNDKLYTRKDVTGRFMQVASQRSEQILNRLPEISKSENVRTDFQKTADDILLTKYTPAGVVVNEAMDIVYFRGNTANYLEQAPGKPSHNLLMMAKNGLGFELRNILHKAKAEKVPVIKENIPLSVNGQLLHISIEAVPLPNTVEPYYLILFHDNNTTDTNGSVTGNTKKVSAKTKKEEKDIQIQLLEQELAQAREDMRSITEDQEASNEELQSANEELLSGSEELQSLNEELETSKEELQSTNEELTVLNHELISLNEQVTDARNYSESIVATLYQPLLVLDKNLRVKTANKSFYKTFKVNEQETEGELIYDLGNRQWNIPQLRTLLEEILPQKKQIIDYEVTHNFLSIGERVILLSALEITREKKEEKLILLSIEDITERISAQKKIEQSENRYDELVRSSPSLISICKGENMIIEIANDAILESWGKGNIIGQSLFDAIPESREQGFDKLLLGVYKTGVPWQAFEVPATLLRKGKKELAYFNILYQPQRNLDGEIEGVAIISTEVTPQAEFNLKIKASEEQFRSLVTQAPVAICILKGKEFIVEVANNDYLQIVGKTENEFVGKPVFDSLPETRSIAEPVVLEVLKTGVPYFGNELEITINKFDKKENCFFNFVNQPIKENDGTTTGIIVVATDVTEQVLARKKVEESETKYRSLFETMDQGFCIVDVLFDKHNNPIDYLFIEVNPVFEQQTGLKNAVGKTIRELVPNLEKHWLDSYGKVAATGESIRFVEGSVAMGRMFEVYAFKVGEAKSHRVAILFTDITERKKAENNLIESEDRFRSLVMATSDTVYKMSADWKVMYNLEGKDFLANTMDSNISWLEKYIPKDERPGVLEAIEKAIADKNIFEHEHQVFDADGNIAWTYSRAVPKLNDAGEIIEWTGAASNITNRKKAEQTLIASESRFRNLVEKTSTPICILKGDDMVLDMANDSVFKIWHVGKEALGKPLFEILPEMKDQPFMGYLLDVYKNGVTHYGNEEPAYYIRENGEIETVYFNFVFQPFQEDDGIISGVMVLGTDITEQVFARKKVEESEHRFHELIYSSPSMMAICKGENMIIEIANDAVLASWGKGKDIIGKSIFLVLPETVEQGFDKLLLSVYKTGEPVHAYEAPVTLLRNGTKELVYYNFIYQPQRNVNGVIEGVAIIANEVTPQALLNKKIKESEAFNRAVLDSSPDCIKMMDEEGRLQFMNSNGICLLELNDFKQIQNTYWWDMWEPDNRQIIKDAVATAKSGQKIQLQLFGPTAKGTPKWWDIIVLPVHEEGTDKNLYHILSVSRDITKQKLDELKEKELLSRFQSLVLEAPVAICVLRGENFIIEVINKGMYEMWDRTLEEALDKPVFEVLPELMEQGIKELLGNVYKTGERFVADELPINLKRKGKIENAFVKFVYEPLREADGTISGVMALAHEITEQVTFRKKIEESDKRFQAAVSAVEGIVWTNNAKGEMQGEQLGWSLLTGQSYEAYQGYGWVEAVHPDDKQPTIDGWNEALRERRNFIFQHRVKGRDGNWRHFSIKAIPLFSEDGSLSEWVGVHTDITEQYRAEKAIKESENRFRQMAELMPQKVWTADAKGNKNYFNKTLLDYAGCSFEELKGDGWQKIIHPEDWEIDKIKWEKSIRTGQHYDVENRLLRKDGKYLWHLTRAVALKDENGEIKMWVGAKTEIQKIKEEEERKGDFIKMVSHELKTPVTSIKGYVQMLLSMLKDNPETEVAGLPLLSSLTRIDSQVLRLTRLITEMLDLTRLETGKLELKKELFGLEELVNETVKDITYTNTKHIINIHTDFNGMVYGDKDRLGQVLINLINNAIKYSTDNNQIDVNIYQPENNLIAVSVKDYGIGINKKDQLKIFERFFRAGGMSEHTYAGFGIGLYIANEIIERHQGFISVDSEEGKGSTFTFTLPLATANEM